MLFFVSVVAAQGIVNANVARSDADALVNANEAGAQAPANDYANTDANMPNAACHFAL